MASLAGACTGWLVLWERRHSQAVGASVGRRWAVFLFGTAATVVAAVAFAKAFRGLPRAQAAMLVMLVTNWVAVLQSAHALLPLPAVLLEVRAIEFSLLKRPWFGVRLFGLLLRRTPLRFLGGPVFLKQLGRDPRALLHGLHAAQAVHLWALLFSSPWLVFWAAHGNIQELSVALAVHLPLNIYPILHLRFVTWRVERAVHSGRFRPRHDLSPTGASPNTLS